MWNKQQLRERAGFIRLFLCILAALSNGIYLALQGNGCWIWSGFFLGLLLGFAGSIALLFGFPPFLYYLWHVKPPRYREPYL